MIRSKPETEQTVGSCSIVEVEISDETKGGAGTGHTGFHVYESAGWEFTCEACDAYSTGLLQADAERELRVHACPPEPRSAS